MPPVISTRPVGSTIALGKRRAVFIAGCSASRGAPPLMSIIVAPALAGRPSPLNEPLPPTTRMRPGAYMTAVLVAPTLGRVVALGASLKRPATDSVPLPAGSRYHMVSAETPKTRPSGATQARG